MGLKIAVCWHVKLCRVVKMQWRCRGKCCLHHRGR